MSNQSYYLGGLLSKCNMLPSATCTICTTEFKSVDHLFFYYMYAMRIWNHLSQMFGLNQLFTTISTMWGPRGLTLEA